MGRLYPKAILVPVHSEETVAQNKIPRQYVEYVSELTGQETALQIVQTNKVNHTKAPAWWRFIKRAKFTGEVEAGRDYIIADDYVTMGGTVSDLRRYIENQGGRVVAAAALAVASSERTGSSADLALTRESLIALETKFTNNGLKELLKEYGIYEGNPKSLTENEARWLLTFSSLENVRERLVRGLREGWTAETQKKRKSKKTGRSRTEQKAFYLETGEEADALQHLATKLLYDPFIHEQTYETELFQRQRLPTHPSPTCQAGGNERSRQVDARRNRATQSGCGRGCQDWEETFSRENGERKGIDGGTNEPLHRLERYYTAGDFAKAKARPARMGHDIDGQPDRDFRKALSGEPSPRYERAHSSMLGSKQETVPAHEGLLNGVADTLICYGSPVKTLAASPSSLDSSTIAAIDYNNIARMVDYQVNRANVLLERSDWELKEFDRNRARGKSSAASTGGSFISTGSFRSVSPREFVKARNQSKRMTFLSEISPDDLKEHRLYLAHGGKVGYAIDKHGDLQNVFNNGGPKGAGGDAVIDAIKNGATTLDCFNIHLPDFYARYGFVVTGRMKFNDEFAPKDWDYELDKRPDIMFMAYQGGDRATIENRVGTFNGPLQDAKRYYTDWDSAKADSRTAAMGHDAHGQRDNDFRKALSGKSPRQHSGEHSSALGRKQETVRVHPGLLSDVTDTLIHYGDGAKTFAPLPYSLHHPNIRAIDTNNMARMLDYQLGRAGVLLDGSGWELKGYNPNQPRGKSSSASNSGSFASHGGWPSDFPSIQPMTNGEKLKNHPDYRAGKKGDFKAATRVVEDIANREKVTELGALYPKAKIVPVHAIESAGVNQLPARFADFIAEQNKMDVVWDIVQTNKVHHTDADAASRFINRAQFDGPVEQGRDYIIADDFVTTGGTASELRQYIEHNGGRVVAVTSLAVAGGKYTGSSNNIALKERTLVALKNKFGKDNLHDFLRENNAYNGNITALTENEGRWLLRFSRLDNARNRIAESRSETKSDRGTGVYACAQSRARTTGQEETGVKSMAISPLTDTLIHYGGSIKTLEENGDCWRFGGWLVVFGSHDASRFKDKFTAQTDFDIEDGERRGLYYNHGLDGTIKRTKLGDCRVYVKAAGLWIEGQIRKRTDYLKSHAEKIAANIESFGLSSGAPAHLVERKAVPGGHEILLWPLAEASITPTPAEPLTGCFSLKALVEAGDWGLEAGSCATDICQSLASDLQSQLPEAGGLRLEAGTNASSRCQSPASSLQPPFLDHHSTGLRDGLAFDDHCARVLAAVGELQERVDGLAQMRCVKSGRRWSAGKFETLGTLADGLGLAAEQIRAVAEEHAPGGNADEVLQALARFEAVRARMNGVGG